MPTFPHGTCAIPSECFNPIALGVLSQPDDKPLVGSSSALHIPNTLLTPYQTIPLVPPPGRDKARCACALSER